MKNNPTVLTLTFSTSFLGRTLFIFIIVLRKQTLLETYIPKAKVWSVATQCSACVTCVCISNWIGSYIIYIPTAKPYWRPFRETGRCDSRPPESCSGPVHSCTRWPWGHAWDHWTLPQWSDGWSGLRVWNWPSFSQQTFAHGKWCGYMTSTYVELELQVKTLPLLSVFKKSFIEI